MRWNGGIGGIARCKRASTVFGHKRTSKPVLRWICGARLKGKGVTRRSKLYIMPVPDESYPVILLQSLPVSRASWSTSVPIAVGALCQDPSDRRTTGKATTSLGKIRRAPRSSTGRWIRQPMPRLPPPSARYRRRSASAIGWQRWRTAQTYGISRRNFFGGKQLWALEGAYRATRCACIRSARGDAERACQTSTIPPSAARSARCASAGASLQRSTAAPEALHRSGPLVRSGTTRWRAREEATSQSPHHSTGCAAHPPLLFLPPGHGLATTRYSSEPIDITAY
jgi:hypothetical protein